MFVSNCSRILPHNNKAITYLKNSRIYPGIVFPSRQPSNTTSSSSLAKRNISTASDKSLAGRRRFYKHVNIQPVPPPWEEDESQTIATISSNLNQNLLPRTAPNWYGITLDNRPLRTPLRRPLSLPSLPLALAIAAEWDSQQHTILPAQMPLMTLACTTLDQTLTNPEIAIRTSLGFYPNDTTCHIVDPTEDRVLHRKQVQHWDDLHRWIDNRYGFAPATAVGNDISLLLSRPSAQKGFGLPHPPELLEAIETDVRLLDAFRLTSLQALSTEAKSLLIALAVLDGYWDVDRAVKACRVEEEFQIENWGLVEGGHDYDRLNCRVGIGAAAFFGRCVELVEEEPCG